MPSVRLGVLTTFALLAFAANSLLCRFALAHGGTDPASFTAIRLAAGALVLATLIAPRARTPDTARARSPGRWRSAFALFVYAAGFSLAYVDVGAATGALLLFGAVQATMMLVGLWQGERLSMTQWVGFAAAGLGLLTLLLPGVAAPPFGSALWMIAAGVAWGLYSLWGRGSTDPVADTARNFVGSLPFALGLLLLHTDDVIVDARGLTGALASGALASGLGYVAWYAVVPALGAMRASALQLAVPAITAAAAVGLLGEPLSVRLLVGGGLVLGGLAAVLRGRVAGPAPGGR